MNADLSARQPKYPESRYSHATLSRRVIGVFYEVYNELGPGFLESVYQRAFAIALADAGLHFEREIPVRVHFRGTPVGDFRPDFVVGQSLLVELKAVRDLATEHQAQLLNYLRASPFEVGLLLNFGLEPTIRRLAFANQRKTHLR